jgi:23S rRNA pseudouridine2605 synthase
LKNRWRNERPAAKPGKTTPKPGKGPAKSGPGRSNAAPDRARGGQAKPSQAGRAPARGVAPQHDAAPQPARHLKTLDRVLSKLGVGSRTESREWIEQGRLQVNGRVVRDPEQWVDLDRDRVALDGKPVRAEQKTYLMLYKPKGYLTSYTDPEGRKTIYDLLGTVDQWVFPVGRLDLDTSGLLLVTNDSEFAEHITSPEHHVDKTYLVKSSLLLSDDQLRQLREGIELKDGPTRPAQVRRVRDSEKYSFLEITITEGRNRQVRRMIEALGATVLKLVRVSIGPLRIGQLQMGTWRPLTPDEVHLLRHAGKGRG